MVQKLPLSRFCNTQGIPLKEPEIFHLTEILAFSHPLILSKPCV